MSRKSKKRLRSRLQPTRRVKRKSGWLVLGVLRLGRGRKPKVHIALSYISATISDITLYQQNANVARMRARYGVGSVRNARSVVAR